MLEPYIKRKLKKDAATRYCLRCGKAIVGRRPHATRCLDCAEKRFKAKRSSAVAKFFRHHRAYKIFRDRINTVRNRRPTRTSQELITVEASKFKWSGFIFNEGDEALVRYTEKWKRTTVAPITVEIGKLRWRTILTAAAHACPNLWREYERQKRRVARH